MKSIKIEWTTYGKEGLVEGTEERVKAIDEFYGYFITDHGRVISCKHRVGFGMYGVDLERPLVIKSIRSGGGYSTSYEGIRFNGKHHKYIHRLVAEAFIPNPNNLPNVDHLNHPSNHYKDLEWVTQQENCDRGKNTKQYMIRCPDGTIRQVKNLSKFIMKYVRPGITSKQATGYLGNFKKLKNGKNGYKYIGLVE